MKPAILLLEDKNEEATYIISVLEELDVEVYHSYNGQDLLDTFNETEGVNFIAAVFDMHIENTKAGQTPKSHHLGETKAGIRGVVAGKELRKLSNIPIVFASSYDRETQEKEVRNAGLKGTHTFFSKEEIYMTPAVLLRSLDMAIQAQADLDDEVAPADVVFQEGRVVTFSRIQESVRINNQQKTRSINRIFRQEEILMFQMTDAVNITVTLTNGEEFLKTNLRRPRFIAAYTAMTALHPDQDFLLRGPAHGGTVWINKAQILGYDANHIFLRNGNVINIAEGMYTVLKTAFPTW